MHAKNSSHILDSKFCLLLIQQHYFQHALMKISNMNVTPTAALEVSDIFKTFVNLNKYQWHYLIWLYLVQSLVFLGYLNRNKNELP